MLTFRFIWDVIARLIVTHHWIQVLVYNRCNQQLANEISDRKLESYIKHNSDQAAKFKMATKFRKTDKEF